MPQHALGIGFFASILIGMATRITLGHSGPPIGADRWVWLAVFGLRAREHFPMYFQPRPDEHPG